MPHTIRVRVVASDIDELNHANNTVYLRWVQDAAVAHSVAVGLAMTWFVARGQAFVVRRHEVDYVLPAFLGDELEVETRVSHFGAASSVRHTRIRRISDGALISRATTQWAYIDLRSGRPTRIPEDVKGRYVLDPKPED